MKKFIVGLLTLFLLAPTAFAQTVHTLQSASGDLTAATTTSEVEFRIAFDAEIVLDVTKLTLADADDEVDFYLQTTYDDGTTWTDIQNVHFTTADDGTTTTRVLRIDRAKDGPGTIQSITGTDPAAGAEISETVPANTIWRLNSIMALLVTDANAASRVARLHLGDGVTDFLIIPPKDTQAASTTLRYFGASFGYEASTNGSTNAWPFDAVILSAGFTITTDTILSEAGDNWGAPQLSIEAWHDPHIQTDATMGDNLKSYDRPIGSSVRIRTTVTGASAPTYAFSATIRGLQ